jgi:hypothetical protein
MYLLYIKLLWKMHQYLKKATSPKSKIKLCRIFQKKISIALVDCYVMVLFVKQRKTYYILSAINLDVLQMKSNTIHNQRVLGS